ncbi:MAG TPA: hypothetical protein VLV78_21615 [Thermoanaerobaculia bacterium]|nr:hypothetical protein [Thermoanaerobaculia bacterium]
MRHRITILALVVCAVFATRCFEIEQTIDLKKDMSGTAGFKMGIDFEPMVVIMANMQHSMSGAKGVATKKEIDAAKADFLKQQKDKKKDPAEDPKKMKAEMNKSLPKGITLLDANVDEKEMSVTTMFHFAFDKLDHLVGVKLPSKKSAEGKGGGDPTEKNVIDQPFESLEVLDKGDTFTIRTKPQNPAESVKSETSKESPGKVDPEMEKMMKDAFKKMRVAYKITAPFTVVSTNAMRREGNTLIWEYDYATFEKMSKSGSKVPEGVTVTYKR